MKAVIDALTTRIERELKDKDIAGLSIALVDDQRIIAAGNQEMLRHSGFELRLLQNKR